MAEDEGKITEPEQYQALVVEKPIEYLGMDKVLPLFSDVAVIRNNDQAFQLLFFQIATPITDDRAVLEKLEAIPAHCIAKVVLSPQQTGELFKALQTNISQWQKNMARKTAELQATLAQQAQAQSEGETK